MNLKTFFVLPLVLAGSLSTTIVCAETMNMSSVADSPAGVSKPHNGMSMDAVIQNYGEPENKHNAVGEPPITRWGFSQFTVYFEHNQVIHAVTHR